MKYMEQIAADHGLMNIEEHANKLLSYAPEAVRRLLSGKWGEAGDSLSSADKWAQFCDTIQDHLSNKVRILRIVQITKMLSSPWFFICRERERMPTMLLMPSFSMLIQDLIFKFQNSGITC
jgi:hypothetical protein